jgi:transposase
MQNQIIFDVSMKISFSLTFAQAFKRIALYRLIQLLVTLDSGMHSIVARWIFADNAMNALRDCPNGDNRPIRKGESNRKPSRKERAEMDEPIKRKRYPSDLTDAQWEMIEPSIPAVSAEATVPTIERREIVNAILHVLRTGCLWRQMPHDLPNGKTAHHYFRIWSQQGMWEPIMAHLRKRVRVENGRDPEPSAAIIDSQSIKTAPVRGTERGFDGGKKIYGRKRHVLVDTLGLLLAVKVHSAGIVDRKGGSQASA